MSAGVRRVIASLAFAPLVGIACGVASATFLHLLEAATRFRESHAWIVLALPLAGLAVGLAYERWGKPIERGTGLVLEAAHGGGARLPLRMAPMVLVGTVLTHLFGGSAGREGTAVQMGASLADALGARFRAVAQVRREVLLAGIAGGFGSVFGTPIAGTVFALEVLTIGRLELRALAPAVVAAFVGDAVAARLGVVHTAYPQLARVPLTLDVVARLATVGVAMGLATIAFVELLTRMKKLFGHMRRLPLRMALGGLAVLVLTQALGTRDYLGLGVPVILRAFHDPDLPAWAFAAKMLFTAITLAAGFLGGEVTPLFFVGATLGSVLARVLGLPIELGAGVGIGAVFGAAAKTPIALSIMAAELLGGRAFPHVALVTVIAYVVSGRRGIYSGQRRRAAHSP